ncbi:rhodanese-like domain-containing protein [Saprospira sp. CCB-QB6]|uniref:rhodanese-like domain-containing protein n=1 Tax=Saprospira sp. CCB-QB6 TaxID=3023936 RepID=UPI00234BE286|nr:rhodanese-like domain-containing protein [Saprospira sp. CCB-QB6]WCL82519.1 rhodanese-like domain-containing protein [Saprospira sp. CCB-QB6]
MSFPNLGPAEFKAAFEADENAVVLDVRTPEEIAEGKIEGAIELNFFDDNFQQEVLKLDANKSYYIYCRSGRRSASACAFLAQNGYAEVTNLDGGMMAWEHTQV